MQYENDEDGYTDSIHNEAERDGFFIDLYDCISSIDSQLHDGDTNPIRTDQFAILFEKIFDLSIDKVDTIENVISEKEGDELELFKVAYDGVIKALTTFLDNYWGITFTADGVNSKVDMNSVYTSYHLVFVCFYDFIAKLFAYIIYHNSETYMSDFENDKERLFSNIIEDNYLLNLDTIPVILQAMDPDNYDYKFVFGEPVEEGDEGMYINPDVSINWDAFSKRILKELRLGSGVVNHDIVYKKIERYIKQIEENHIK